jgi:uncharacterized protein YgbK (DUF1537 family)
MSQSPTQLPDGCLVSWYGDDFTGSAAVMEVLTFAGLPSVLFLGVPTDAQKARFVGMRGVGIAGTARSHGPQWMENNLPAVFGYLQKLAAPLTHYKVCSTLDSSPRTGSIGKAIDIAQSQFNSHWVPLLLAAPAIRRYQIFGHLFAAAPDGIYRLDRHPVMSRHPVTPMTESDIRKHIGKQTARRFGLVDVESMTSIESAQLRLEAELRDGAELVALDTVSNAELALAGRLIWENRGAQLFAVGSQGIEYALLAYWESMGLVEAVSEPEGAGDIGPVAVASGSVSIVTAEQIEWSLQKGFTGIQFNAADVIAGEQQRNAAIERVVEVAVQSVSSGSSPIVFTAMGPDDPAVAAFNRAVGASAYTMQEANRLVGTALGQILDRILRRSELHRAIIAGGDTSGHATQQLGVFALTALAPTIPGAALFAAHNSDSSRAVLQLALKGGQMGTPDYFEWIKQGGGAAAKRRIAI